MARRSLPLLLALLWSSVASAAISVNDSVTRWTGTPGATTAITSASFTPADNSLLVVCINSDEGTENVTLSVSGGSLTWTERVRRGNSESGEGLASIFTAPVTTGSSMTVAVARQQESNGTDRLSAKVYVVTGQHASPIGASTSANWSTNNQTTSLTATGDGRLFGCGTEWNALGTPASTDTEDAAHYASSISVMSAYKAADHTAGTQGINFDANGASAPLGNVVVLEVLGASAGGGLPLRRRRAAVAPDVDWRLTANDESFDAKRVVGF